MKRFCLTLAFIQLVSSGVAFCSLSAKNPFLWPDFEVPQDRRQATAPSASDSRLDYLEFHAVYNLGESTHVLVHDRREQAFTWIVLGQEAVGLRAEKYEPDGDRLLVRDPQGERWLDLIGVSPQRRRGSAGGGADPLVDRAGAETARNPARLRVPVRGAGERDLGSRRSEKYGGDSASADANDEGIMHPVAPASVESSIRGPGVSAPSYSPEPPPFLRKTRESPRGRAAERPVRKTRP